MAHESIGKTVRTLRKMRPITQEALAKAAGISRITLIRIEMGQSKPDLDTLERLAKALKTTPSKLLAA